MSGNCNNKPGCEYFENLINKRLDGDINAQENRALNEHLADCDECREELVSYEMIRSLLDETLEHTVEVPDGLFESMAEQLESVKPAVGISGILAHPFFQAQRNYALAFASLVLVAVLTMGVGYGVYREMSPGEATVNNNYIRTDNGLAMIHTNNGDTIVVTDEQSGSELYAAALDDLQRAYEEAQGKSESDESSGYVHTHWSGGDTANPIH